MLRFWTMFRNWFLEGLPDVLRALVLLPVALVVFVLGMFGGGFAAVKPVEHQTCGLPFLGPMMAGGMGALLAYTAGVCVSRPIRAAWVGPLILTIFVSPIVLTDVSRGGFELAARCLGGATGIGIVSGAIGGILGFLLWPATARDSRDEPTLAELARRYTVDPPS